MRVVYNGKEMDNRRLDTLMDPFRKGSGLIGIRCITSFDCVIANEIMKLDGYSILLIPPYLPASMIEDLMQDVHVKKLYTLDHGIVTDCQEVEEPLADIAPSSWLFITSASTGNPKIVYKTKQHLDAEISRYVKKLKVTESDVIFPAVPLYHNYGFVCGLLVSQAVNASLILEENPFPSKVIRRSNEFGVTILYSVPVFYKEMLHCHIKLRSNMKYIIVSCASLDNTLLYNFFNHFGYFLTQQYGATETGSLALGRESDSAGEFSDSMDGVSFFADKETGEILISSVETLGNYMKKNQIVPSASPYYHSGDRGSVHENLKIAGRMDDIVNISGRKISLRYIQDKLSEIPEIHGVSVSSVKLKNGMWIQCEYQENQYSKEELLEYCRQLLPKYCLSWLIHKSAPPHRWKEKSYEDYGNHEREL